MGSNALKIVKLSASNVKRIRAVAIEPDGAIVEIAGNNGNGKSSVLDAIAMTLEGRRAAVPMPVRKGADAAKAVLDLGEIVVTSTWKGEERTSLRIETKDGATLKSPQAVLDAIVGPIAFDPMRFSQSKPKERRDDFLKLVGFDLEAFEARRRTVFDNRTDANRRLRDTEGALAALVPPPDGLEAEVSVSDLIDKLRQVTQANAEVAEQQRKVEMFGRDYTLQQSRVEALREQLVVAEAELKRIEAAGKAAHEALGRMTIYPVDDLRQQIATAEEVNRGVRERNGQREQHRVLSERYSKHAAESVALTAELDRIDAEKAQALAAAPVPIPGLGADADDITLNGVPFPQLATSEQLSIAMALAMNANPRLRVVLLRDGSLLDKNTMRWLRGWAEQHDVQVWVETVGEGDEGAWVIEDGEATHKVSHDHA